MAEIPELTALGTGGNECDVKLGADGVWSYVAKRAWATSDGRRGKIAGTCSVSLSPDGKSITSLHSGHKKCSIEAIRPGGVERTVRWTYRGGFDNHRWASNDTRFIVVADEVDQDSKGRCYPVVMAADGSRGARVASKGFARRGVYGDFAVGDGASKGWLGSADIAPSEGG
jgi:2-polyprenyl-6-methoxyphenol hydroxylase-like FAD-dependent oxidoreductase